MKSLRLPETSRKRAFIFGIVMFLLIPSVFLVRDARSVRLPDGGTPMLNDYFSQDQTIRNLLLSAENHHLFRLPYISAVPKYSIKNLIAEGKIYQAAIEIKYVLDRFPNHPRALDVMADLSLMMEDNLLGVFYFKRALELYPQYAITHFQYGAYLVKIGNDEEGIEELKKSVEIDPNFALSYHMLSVAYAKKGETGVARQYEEKAVSLGYKATGTDNVSADTGIPESME